VPRSVVGDRGRLGQVLSNLLANAVKFTERGEVVARVGVLEEWEDEVVVRFSVRDSGVGIPETALPRLFQPFTQADTSTTRRFGGTGLGLAISKRLVEMMGGGIGVSSTPGEGSTFWFTARFKRQGEPRRAVDPLPLAGRLALIAAPSEAVGETLERQLGALGVIVRRADSVRAARGTLEDESSEDIDLVVLDAGLDGLEVAAFAREVRERSRVTRILLLVPIGAAAVEGGEGPDSVLTKPIRPSVLRERLAAIVTGDTPVTVPEPAGAAPTGVDRHAPLVLVVEDNEINRTVAIRSLERLGYRATGARHGAEAVEKFAPETYAAVLMDCQMPVMDGYEATVQLRAAEVGRRPTPVLALTAGALVGDRERCLAAGMDDYIAKPVVFEQLAATLARWAPVGTVSVDAPLFSMPATAGLDTRVIDQLRALDTPGSGFFQGVIGLFLDTTPGRLAALARALAEHDLATVQAVAHGLRSTCGNVGARRMHDLCAEIEEGAGNGGQELALRLRALGDEFAEVRQALEAEQRRVRPGASAAGSSS
jgi:two-component system sensor histidine kinase/response regulator